MSVRFEVYREGLFDDTTVWRAHLFGEWGVEATRTMVGRPRQLALGVAFHLWEPWGCTKGPLTGITVRLWMATVSLGIRAPRTAAQIAEAAGYDDDYHAELEDGTC